MIDTGLPTGERLSHFVVRILATSANQNQSAGTGFFYAFRSRLTEVHDMYEQSQILLMTNKHVISGSSLIEIRLTAKFSDRDYPDYNKHYHLIIEANESDWIQHPDPSVDLCGLPFDQIWHTVTRQLGPIYLRNIVQDIIPKGDDVINMKSAQEVLMIGYPNGLWDEHNNLPIVRRGITATHIRHNLNNKKEFMIDAACFPGSSGSPVFVYNDGMWNDNRGRTVAFAQQLLFIGILYAGPISTNTGEVMLGQIETSPKVFAFTMPINLGLIIKSEEVLELEPLFTPKTFSWLPVIQAKIISR